MDEILNRILDMMNTAGPYAFWASMAYLLLYFLVSPLTILLCLSLVGRFIIRLVPLCSDDTGAWAFMQVIAGTNFPLPLTPREKAVIRRRIMEMNERDRAAHPNREGA